MKMHLAVAEGKVACGKNDHDLMATSEPARVTCKMCRSTTGFQNAINTAGLDATINRNVGLLPKQLWTQYIRALRGTNRLPRGLR